MAAVVASEDEDFIWRLLDLRAARQKDIGQAAVAFQVFSEGGRRGKWAGR